MKSLFYLCASLALITVLNACGGSGGSSSSTTTDLVGDCPFEMKVPASYDANTPTPLIVVLHGYGGDGDWVMTYFRMDAAAERHGFLVAYPDGVRDAGGRRHWNATEACRASGSNFQDDVAYLSAVLDDVESRYNIDTRQIFFIGHSNGGYMSHRMACDRSSRVAAIVSLAGASWKDPDDCQTQQPVSVLQVHGDLDTGVLYDGGFSFGFPYPSAVETVSDWADRNGCTGTLMDKGPNLNIDVTIGGDETRVQSFTGCPGAGEAELWTILGGRHSPDFDDSWPDFIWSFLSSHPRP